MRFSVVLSDEQVKELLSSTIDNELFKDIQRQIASSTSKIVKEVAVAIEIRRRLLQ